MPFVGRGGAAHQRFADQVGELGGTVLGSEALQPPRTATSYRSGVTAPGTFVSSAEMFCGYYLSEAADGAAAVEIAALCPVRFGGVEVRPIMDFA